MNEFANMKLAMVKVLVPRAKRVRRSRVKFSVDRTRTTQRSCDSYNWSVPIPA